MPRDFVPCLYAEREMEDAVTQTWHLRCEVVEAFASTHVLTRQPECFVSIESHAYHVQVSFACCPQHAGMPPQGRDDLARRERHRLFEQFYAAMAALE